jgi:hypothetical protein
VFMWIGSAVICQWIHLVYLDIRWVQNRNERSRVLYEPVKSLGRPYRTSDPSLGRSTRVDGAGGSFNTCFTGSFRVLPSGMVGSTPREALL